MTIKRLFPALASVALLLGSCATPKNIEYFQGMSDDTALRPSSSKTITLQPMDQVSIIVNSRDPQITSLFNLPYYTKRLGETQSLTTASNVLTSQSSQNVSGYTVDSGGFIDFPVLGPIRVQGMKREEVAETIKQKLIESRQVKDPVVTVEYMNLGVSVLGEVLRPGRYKIDRDQFTIFDALSLAGDLTINGQRTNVAVIRHAGKQDEIYRIDLSDARKVYDSPAYYIAQGDMIYVSPNNKRKRESTVNANNVRSSSFWISLASLATTIAVLILK